MKQLLEEKVRKASGYLTAKNRQLKLLCNGLDLEHEG